MNLRYMKTYKKSTKDNFFKNNDFICNLEKFPNLLKDMCLLGTLNSLENCWEQFHESKTYEKLTIYLKYNYMQLTKICKVVLRNKFCYYPL